MKTTYYDISGDFSINALSLRLLAPNHESLLRHFPHYHSTNTESWNQRFSDWHAYSQKINWKHEALSIRYIANYIHEFIHLIQHTTLFQCMGQVHLNHMAINLLIDRIKTIIYDEKQINLPLINWLNTINNPLVDEIQKVINVFDSNFRLYQGDEDFVNAFCNHIGEKLENVYTNPFNPRIKHLEINNSSFEDVPITTEMLLESQATLITYRFVTTFFGNNYARDLVLGAGSNFGMGLKSGIRVNYDILPLIAIEEKMEYFIPLLIDWAFEGTSCLPNESTKVHYSNIHPGWRFVKLFNAAVPILKNKKLHFEVLAELDLQYLKSEVFNAAEVPIDKKDEILSWIQKENNQILKKVFQRNIKPRLEKPNYYLLFEIFFPYIREFTYIPMTFFRDDFSNQTHHSALYNPKDDLFDPFHLSQFSQRAYDIELFFNGIIPSCPFCNGVNYTDFKGNSRIKYPPLGRTGMVTKDFIVSANCNCSWAYNFKEFWGLLPDEIKYLTT